GDEVAERAGGAHEGDRVDRDVGVRAREGAPALLRRDEGASGAAPTALETAGPLVVGDEAVGEQRGEVAADGRRRDAKALRQIRRSDGSGGGDKAQHAFARRVLCHGKPSDAETGV